MSSCGFNSPEVKQWRFRSAKHHIGRIVTGFIITAVLFGSCGCQRDGFRQINGEWSYVTTTAGSGTVVNNLHASSNTFQVLAHDFAKDADRVFYKRFVVEGADPSTFEVLDRKGYAKDEKQVYLMQYNVREADPSSFQVLKWPYARDDKNVFCGNVKMFVADVKNFEPVKCYGNVRSIYKRERFVEDFGKAFDFVTATQSEPAIVSSAYGRDGVYYYYGPARIEGADYATFRILDRYTGRDKDTIFDGIWAK
jgi:DKNYY family